jgi:hypothetical protein
MISILKRINLSAAKYDVQNVMIMIGSDDKGMLKCVLTKKAYDIRDKLWDFMTIPKVEFAKLRSPMEVNWMHIYSHQDKDKTRFMMCEVQN